VATTDETGAPLCLLHAALELGGRDGQQTGVFELLQVIGATIAQDGLCAPEDAIKAFAEAVGQGETQRQKLGLKPVPSFEQTLAALTALTAAARLDDREEN
jgi:hypothetical protein